TPGPSPARPSPGEGRTSGNNSFDPSFRFILNFSPLPAGAWVGDGRGAGGEVLFGSGRWRDRISHDRPARHRGRARSAPYRLDFRLFRPVLDGEVGNPFKLVNVVRDHDQVPGNCLGGDEAVEVADRLPHLEELRADARRGQGIGRRLTEMSPRASAALEPAARSLPACLRRPARRSSATPRPAPPRRRAASPPGGSPLPECLTETEAPWEAESLGCCRSKKLSRSPCLLLQRRYVRVDTPQDCGRHPTSQRDAACVSQLSHTRQP